MAEDYANTSLENTSILIGKLLNDLNRFLHQYGKTIGDFDLPSLPDNFQDNSYLPRIIEDDLLVPVCESDVNSVQNLNENQQYAFGMIMNAIERDDKAIFFVDGPDGTEKTFIWGYLSIP